MPPSPPTRLEGREQARTPLSDHARDQGLGAMLGVVIGLGFVFAVFVIAYAVSVWA